MKDGESIILNSSIAGVKGFPGNSVYSASKLAVRSFARTWTAEAQRKDQGQCHQSRYNRYCHVWRFSLRNEGRLCFHNPNGSNGQAA